MTTFKSVESKVEESEISPEILDNSIDKVSPPLPEQYNDNDRNSLSEEPTVAAHLEAHWGF